MHLVLRHPHFPTVVATLNDAGASFQASSGLPLLQYSSELCSSDFKLILILINFTMPHYSYVTIPL